MNSSFICARNEPLVIVSLAPFSHAADSVVDCSFDLHCKQCGSDEKWHCKISCMAKVGTIWHDKHVNVSVSQTYLEYTYPHIEWADIFGLAALILW